MRNLLLDEPVPYKVEETPFGVWRRFASEQFGYFEEFVSHRQLFGLPLLHYTRGRCPETGTSLWAFGIVAIGRRAVGVVAIGQLSGGLVAIGQLAIGVMFGLGQATTGVVAIGQAAMGVAFGFGQAATGFVAIGQVAAGVYVLAMRGIGRHVWDMAGCHLIARQFFESLIR
jgi:hypothetical protein